MKFESKFGIGEIVSSDIYKGENLVSSEMYKVVYIVFEIGSVTVGCRHPASGMIMQFKEGELTGDDDFSQKQGKYIETTT